MKSRIFVYIYIYTICTNEPVSVDLILLVFFEPASRFSKSTKLPGDFKRRFNATLVEIYRRRLCNKLIVY